VIDPERIEIELSDVRQILVITRFGSQIGRGMDALMVNGLDPGRELPVQFLQASGPIAFDPERTLEAPLDRLNHPLAFSFAPGVIRLGVQEPYPQVRTDDVRVLVDERLALVGIEFERQAPAQHRLLQRIEKGFGVGPAVVGGEWDQP